MVSPLSGSAPSVNRMLSILAGNAPLQRMGAEGDQSSDDIAPIAIGKSELSDAVSPLTDEHGLGWMTDEQWKDLYDMLLEFEALPGPFDYKTAFTDRFLREAYDGGELRWP